MRNWTIKKRVALKSAVGALARRVGSLVRRTRRLPMTANSKTAPPPLGLQESSANGRKDHPPSPRKRINRAALAVEDGFKEF
jgi:hypothetical protein